MNHGDEGYCTLDLTIQRQGEAYLAEFSLTDPTNHARIAPVRDVAPLDPAALRAFQLDAAGYGSALSTQLFQPTLKQYFLQAEARAVATGRDLRVSVRVDPSAQELHSLRWELLRHPERGYSLATSETTLLSRFIISTDWRPVHLRAQTDLRALIAISAPPAEALARGGLAPVDFTGESQRIRKSLGDVDARVLGGPDDPFTLDRLLALLRDGIDILYIVSHGAFARSTGLPSLFLQGEDGGLRATKGDELAVRISELKVGPRLVVLASCQSAGDGGDVASSHRGSVQSTIAARLGDAGVPAVLAMQGFITMATIERMMPVFFTELLRDGQIDRALAVARGVVRERDDHWMPALFLRLSSGKIWYNPGFVGGKAEATWKRLLKPVREGKLVPILGSGLYDRTCGSSFEVARALADKNGFPLAENEWDDLPRVTQFLIVRESRFNTLRAVEDQWVANAIALHRHWLPPAEIPPLTPNPRLSRILSLVLTHQRQHDADDPFRILSELPASVYVTTTFDPAMSWALSAVGRTPTADVSRWRFKRSAAPTNPNSVEATVQKPLVFHVFGAFGKEADDTLVISEDDYFDYLIATAEKLVPPRVESALVDNSLLILGFRLTDWSFRVLFRLIMNLPGKDRLKQYCHVAVQMDPDLHSMADLAGAKTYLAEYFGQEANVDIYWGSAREFLVQLRDEMKRAGTDAAPPPPEEADGWDF